MLRHEPLKQPAVETPKAAAAAKAKPAVQDESILIVASPLPGLPAGPLVLPPRPSLRGRALALVMAALALGGALGLSGVITGARKPVAAAAPMVVRPDDGHWEVVMLEDDTGRPPTEVSRRWVPGKLSPAAPGPNSP